MDKISKEKRSWNMSRIKSADTAPELFVRSLLHHAGYRFRLHVKSLPGKPDIVLPKYKTVIEVRGCFWHMHKNCTQGRVPSTQKSWWEEKLTQNAIRDHNNYIQLRESGWRILIVWGCVFKGISNEMKACLDDILLDIISTFLQDAQAQYVEIDRISCLEIRNKIPLEG